MERFRNNKNYKFLQWLNGIGLTQVSLAKKCKKMSEPMLSRIINGHHSLSESQIIDIAHATGSTIAVIKSFFIEEK